MAPYLSSFDLCSIRNLGHTLLDCETDIEIRTVALEKVEPIFRTHAANFYLTSFQGGRWITDDVVTRGLPANMHHAYNQYYHQKDPFRKIEPHPGRALRGQEVLDWSWHIKNEYYNDFLLPQDIGHIMNMWVSCENDIFGVLAFFRPLPKTPFKTDDCILCELTSPILSSAFQKIFYKNKIYRMQMAAKALMAEVPIRGVLILDEQFQIICMNNAATRILAAANNTIEDPAESSLPMEIVQACMEIKGKAHTGISTKAFPIVMKKPMEVINAEARLIEFEAGSSIFLIRLGEYKLADNWVSRLKFKHISRREMDVVQCVLEGLTNKEISNRLYISEYTVENHLRSIYKKVDVKNRARLIRQVIEPT